jgi:hypothetical protein
MQTQDEFGLLPASAGFILGYSLTLKMEVTHSFERMDSLQNTWCYNPEDCALSNNGCETHLPNNSDTHQ